MPNPSASTEYDPPASTGFKIPATRVHKSSTNALTLNPSDSTASALPISSDFGPQSSRLYDAMSSTPMRSSEGVTELNLSAFTKVKPNVSATDPRCTSNLKDESKSKATKTSKPEAATTSNPPRKKSVRQIIKKDVKYTESDEEEKEADKKMHSSAKSKSKIVKKGQKSSFSILKKLHDTDEMHLNAIDGLKKTLVFSDSNSVNQFNEILRKLNQTHNQRGEEIRNYLKPD
jgi:hypothetical protein